LNRSGSAVTNFSASLPKPQSDLARESLKDPYRFDFLGLSREAGERKIENALVKNVTEFLFPQKEAKQCSNQFQVQKSVGLGD
jgi:predicted nuclease of restriction endonuclease-like (RecB) superfamily